MDLRLEQKEMILAKYMDYLSQRGYANRTNESYEGYLRRHFRFLEEEHIENIRAVEKDDIKRYQQYLYSRSNLSLAAQANCLTGVKSFYLYLEKTAQIIHNPAAIIELPRLNKRLPRNILTSAQINRLFNIIDLESLTGLRDRAMFELFYSTGIRSSELLNLKLYDVDFTNHQIMIRHGKGDKDRVVPMGEIAEGYLEEYLRGIMTNCQSTNDKRNSNIKIQNLGKENQNKFSNNESRTTNDSHYLFVSCRGKKLTRGMLSWIFNKYRESAGIKFSVTPHTLRHCCATHMLKKGAPIRYIQQLLGHSSLDTTQIYTQVEISDLKRTHKKTHPRELGR